MSVYRIAAEIPADRAPRRSLRQLLGAYPFVSVALFNSVLFLAESSFYNIRILPFYVLAIFRVLMVVGYSLLALGEEKKRAHEKANRMRLRS